MSKSRGAPAAAPAMLLLLLPGGVSGVPDALTGSSSDAAASVGCAYAPSERPVMALSVVWSQARRNSAAGRTWARPRARGA